MFELIEKILLQYPTVHITLTMKDDKLTAELNAGTKGSPYLMVHPERGVVAYGRYDDHTKDCDGEVVETVEDVVEVVANSFYGRDYFSDSWLTALVDCGKIKVKEKVVYEIKY